jgi:cell wall assembly regulator SMI1
MEVRGRSWSVRFGMAINELVALVPPPAIPLGTDGDWSGAEADLGCKFPADFRELIRRYGTGQFDLGGLLVSNPLTAAGRQEIRDHLETLRDLREGCEIQLVIHPERPGLLPWGSDSLGNIFCWLTEGEPDKWPVVQVGHDDEGGQPRVEVGITAFLARYARNEFPKMLVLGHTGNFG